MNVISIQKTYSGKQILVTGGSGFLGKVWIAMLLDHVPEIGKIHILIRRNGYASVEERFEKMVQTSPVFKPLYEKHGEGFSNFISERVEIIEGDASLPNFGIPDSLVSTLAVHLDLVVNFAGLVEFNPDVREAYATNVLGALHAAQFVKTCEKAKLLHISTCYVSGIHQGEIAEKIESRTPNGKEFDVHKEIKVLETLIRKVEAQKDPNGHNGNGKNPVRIAKRKLLRQAMIDLGLKRAHLWGWTNTYTYTKAMAERLIQEQGNQIQFTVFRPSIVESSMEYPFPGWNEGFNTSGPLAYLLGTWFRYLPAKMGNPFDVIPVDIVAKGLTISGAALISNRNPKVVQCGTSDLNLFTIDRACELTSLGHRIHYRTHGKSTVERLLLSRWDTVPAPQDHFLSIPNLHRLTNSVRTFLKFAPLKKANELLFKLDRKFTQIEELLDLFKPFIHDNRWIFLCKELKNFQVEEKQFRFEPEKIRWRDYWLHIHMPGLRRWCFPAIENRRNEILQTELPFKLMKTTGLKAEKIKNIPIQIRHTPSEVLN